MKYHAPYGSSDPDASYVDRNTPGATSGSRVPAPAIEAPQREIVDVISKAGLVTADELQLAEAIQSGILNFAVAAGTANAITTSLSPDLTAYKNGLSVNLKITTPNTGAATINIDGLGAKQIVNADGGALSAGDLTGVATLIYDGAKFVVSNVSQATETARGVVELASATEVAAGSDLSRPAAVGRTAVAIQNQIYQYGGTAGGTVNALTVTLTPAPAALVEGLGIVFDAAGSNTGNVTINVNGLGAKALLGPLGQQLSAGDLTATRLVYAVYNGASFRFVGAISATEAVEGSVELATAAEMLAGADLARVGAVGRTATAIQNQSWQWAGNAGGTANVITLAMTPTLTAYTTGMGVIFVAQQANTGAVTLNIDGLGAKTLRHWNKGNALTTNDLIQFRVCYCIYDGVNFNLMGEVLATETASGTVELAAAAEVTAGTDLNRPAAVGRMSDVIQSGAWLYAVAGGTANALTATYTPGPPVTDGMVLQLKIVSTNTGPATLAVNGGAATNIVGFGNTALNAGDLRAGDIVEIVRSSALGAWVYRGRQQGQLISRRVFTTSGTYTPTPGTTSVIVTCVGAGGGGGGSTTSTSSQSSAAGGGGSGGLTSAWLTSGFSGVTMTIGAGGAGGSPGGTGGNGGQTTFGALLTAGGGVGASGVVASVNFNMSGGGGAANQGSGGSVNLKGIWGVYGVSNGSGGGASGSGGASPLGGGSGNPAGPVTGSGGAGLLGGGGGGGFTAPSGSGASGGAGGGGIIIIDEYA